MKYIVNLKHSTRDIQNYYIEKENIKATKKRQTRAISNSRQEEETKFLFNDKLLICIINCFINFFSLSVLDPDPPTLQFLPQPI
jgi:hypothetical protein